jgi:hypothetical protein
MDQLGADGVTTESNVHGIYLGDERYVPLLAELDRRRTPVFVHPTSPPDYESVSMGRPRPMLEFIFDSTRAVSDLVFSGRVHRYPNIPRQRLLLDPRRGHHGAGRLRRCRPPA